jgi:competence protein ComEA
MLVLNEKERLALSLLGLSALLAVGVIVWQQRKPAINIKRQGSVDYEKWDNLLTEAKQVNVNIATSRQLEKLPKIGPSLAKQIVDYRDAHGPFQSLQDLEKVPGLGPKTIKDTEEYVIFE